MKQKDLFGQLYNFQIKIKWHEFKMADRENKELMECRGKCMQCLKGCKE